MKVIDHEPQMWFLLQDDDGLLLDVNCSHSAFGYSVLIELEEDETRNFQNEGHVYLNQLAGEINFSAPGVRGSSSPYQARNIRQARGDEVMAVVREWQNS
ncbi:TPA: hypothetical protein ACKP1B_001267 [Serratia fonticola]